MTRFVDRLNRLRHYIQLAAEHVRSAARPVFDLSREDISVGARMTVIAVIPLIIGPLIGQPQLGLMCFFSGLYAASADTGGAYQTRAIAMGSATVCMAVFALIASVAGGIPWLAITLTLLCAFGWSMLGVYGNIGSKVGFVVIATFLILLGQPVSFPEALARMGAFFIGGVWGIVVTLWSWPLRPYQPTRAAVANYYRALASFISKISTLEDGHENSGLYLEETVMQERIQVIDKRNKARDTLMAIRSLQQGASSTGQQLALLTLQGNRLFDITIALAEGIQIAPQQIQEQIQAAWKYAIQQAANVLRQIADTIEHEKRGGTIDGNIDVNELERVIEEVSEQVDTQRKTPPRSVTDYVALTGIRHTIRILKHFDRVVYSVVDTIQHESLGEQEQQTLNKIKRADRRGSREAIQTLLDNLTPDSLMFRHALHIAIASGAGVTFYTVLHIAHGFWIPLTALIILKPDFGGTRQRIIQRVSGTVFGSIVAILLVAIIHSEIIIYLLIALLGFVAYSHRLRNYGIFVLFLTPFVVLMINLFSPGDWQIAMLRILNTLIGGVLALVAYLLWPQWESEHLPEQLASTIATNREFFHCVMAAHLMQENVQGNDTESLRQADKRAHLENNNAATAFQRLLSDPKTQQRNVKEFYALITYNQHICDSITALAAYRFTMSGQHTLPGLKRLAQQIEDAMQLLEQAVCAWQHHDALASKISKLEESLQRVQGSIQTLIKTRMSELAANQSSTPTREAIRDFAPMGRQLEHIVHDIAGMEQILRQH